MDPREPVSEPSTRPRSPEAAVIEATQDAVLAIDSHARVTLANPAAAKMFGYPLADLLGKRVNELMGEPYAAEHDEYIRRYEQTGERRAIGRTRMVSGRRSNGQEFPIELSVAEYEDDGERRYAAILRDISAKVRAQQERLHVEKMAAVGTTASKFAHELGNPINGMAVSAQLLSRWLDRMEPPVEGRIKRRLELLLAGLDRLTELLGEFRSMSRRHEYRFDTVDLRAMVAEMVEMERPYYAQRGVAIETDIDVDLGPVRADAGKLRQVLLNLCKNGLEAMPEGGLLVICATRVSGGVRVDVRDTGAGVAPGVDVFAPFTSSKSGGSGLGLAIAKQIVEAHQGSLSFESVPQRGTTFCIRLPN